jgi:hypothetical protein
MTGSQEGETLEALDVLDVLNDGGGGDKRIAVDYEDGKEKLRRWARVTNRTIAGMLRHILDVVDMEDHDGAWHIISREDPAHYSECQDESGAGE